MKDIKKIALPIIFVFVFIGLSSSAWCETQIGGVISSDTVWNQAGSPYVVTASIIIGNGATLEIEPNVVVKIDPGLSIIVGSANEGEGTLIAKGQAGHPVTFTSNATSPSPGDWSHIHFTDYANSSVIFTPYDEYEQPLAPYYFAGSLLEHVVIEYGGYGDFAALFIENSGVYINNCCIKNNAAFALQINNSIGARDLIQHIDFPMIRDCDISNNYGGLYLHDIENYSITSNHIHNNQGPGILLESGSWNLIQGNTINNNQYPLQHWNIDYNTGGLLIQSGNYNDIIGNIICHNASFQNGGGIGVYSGYENNIGGNIVCNNSALTNGGGIYNYSSNDFADNFICGNIASENGGGVSTGGGTFIGNYIEKNSAKNGGGIAAAYSATFEENVIRHNNADFEGGAAYFSGAVILTNNWFTNNYRKQGQTGGIFVASDASLIRIAGDPNENSFNRIWQNDGIQLYNDCPFIGDNNLQAQYICWGTDDYNTIEDGIFDFYKDSTHAFIYWQTYINCQTDVPDPCGFTCPSGLNGFGGGYGSVDSPYLIYTAEQLQNIGNFHFDWDKHFKLMADIDLGELGPVNFNIIGGPPVDDPVSPGKAFSGTFDGNGHVISNLQIVTTDLSDIGLFGFVNGGIIQNLGLISPYVDAGGGRNVGALVGYAINDTTIENCWVEGGTLANAEWSIGGLAGIIDGTITNCHTSCNVSGDTSVGGLVGGFHGTDAVISDCYASGDVQGTGTYLGGLVGHGGYAGSEIRDCYANGNVEGFEHVGGLVGAEAGCYIHGCHASGIVKGQQWVGGLVGSSYILEACYATGDVYGFGYVGGLVGSGRSLYDCFAAGDIYVIAGLAGSPGNFGGLAGIANDEIAGCFATGNVNPDHTPNAEDVGGLIGENSAIISDCYARGSTFGHRDIGGLIGSNHNAVFRCYATGNISGDEQWDQYAGIAGYEQTWGQEINNCFWDTQTTNMTTSKGGTGKNTVLMYNQNTYLAAGWDFADENTNGTDDTWTMPPGDYPHLAWETEQYSIASCQLTVIVTDGDGDVIPAMDYYTQASTATVTAVPAPGWRVKSWNNTNNDSSTLKTNSVLMDDSKQVSVAFEQVPPIAMQIRNCIVIPAAMAPNGMFLVSGSIPDCPGDLGWSKQVQFNFGPYEETISDFVQFGSTYLYSGTGTGISLMLLNLNQGSFMIMGRSVDLTGLSNPIPVEVKFIDYAGTNSYTARNLSLRFMSGFADFLRIDYALATINSLSVRGGIALANPETDLNDHEITISWGLQLFTIPAGLFREIGTMYLYSDPLGANGNISFALFDLNRCTFTIMIRNAAIDQHSGTVPFRLQFGSFDQTANYSF